MTQDTAMTTYHAPSVVMPLADPDAARAAIKAYTDLKAAIVQPHHVHSETRTDSRTGEVKVVRYLKKNYWRDMATFFGLSLELVNETREKDEKGALAYSVYYRAVAPNGRTMIGDGYCSRSEGGKGYWSEHNIRGTAHTRAKNRAISDMIGGGEVSYEEMFGDEDQEAPNPAPKQVAAPTRTPQPRQTVVEATYVDEDPEERQEAVAAPSGSFMTVPQFIAAIGAEFKLDAGQAMKHLGIRSLQGINLTEALETLRTHLAKQKAAGKTTNAAEAASVSEAAGAQVRNYLRGLGEQAGLEGNAYRDEYLRVIGANVEPTRETADKWAAHLKAIIASKEEAKTAAAPEAPEAMEEAFEEFQGSVEAMAAELDVVEVTTEDGETLHRPANEEADVPHNLTKLDTAKKRGKPAGRLN